MLNLKKEDIKKLENIGSGAFGTVYKFNDDYAIKVYHDKVKTGFGLLANNPQLRRMDKAIKLKRINKRSYIDNEVKITHNESVTINKTMASINKYKILKDSQKVYAKYYLHANAFEMFVLRFVYYISLIIAYIVYFFSKLFKKKK